MWGRKPGAQKKNQNARKHGFYSAAFNKEGKNLLARAARIDAASLSNEIDLARATILQLKAKDPKNVVVLQLCLRTLVRIVAVNHALNRRQEDELHDSLQHLITTLLPAAGGT